MRPCGIHYNDKHKRDLPDTRRKKALSSGSQDKSHRRQLLKMMFEMILEEWAQACQADGTEQVTGENRIQAEIKGQRMVIYQSPPTHGSLQFPSHRVTWWSLAILIWSPLFAVLPEKLLLLFNRGWLCDHAFILNASTALLCMNPTRSSLCSTRPFSLKLVATLLFGLKNFPLPRREALREQCASLEFLPGSEARLLDEHPYRALITRQCWPCKMSLQVFSIL